MGPAVKLIRLYKALEASIRPPKAIRRHIRPPRPYKGQVGDQEKGTSRFWLTLTDGSHPGPLNI